MPRTPRARSARALANDAAIRAAGVAEVLRVGVDHLSLRDVGHRAGLTHGATYARYEDVDELLVDLWNSTMLTRAIALYDLCAALVREPSPEHAADLRRWIAEAVGDKPSGGWTDADREAVRRRLAEALAGGDA